MTYKITASNISCDGCVDTIKTELKKISGVESVEVNKATQEITVSSTTSKEHIVARLNEIGYPVQN